MDESSELDIIQNNFLIGAFLYYFLGLIISRFGSLVIEPILKKTKFIEFADYSDFIKASKGDEKIGLLSEVNNTYRTLLSMSVLLILFKAYLIVMNNLNWSTQVQWFILFTCLVVLFVFSYKKQTSYIKKRVNNNIKIDN
jgi:hypothetical protein